METQQHNEFSRSIGRLEGKLDLVVASVGSLNESFQQMEKGRLSKLEVAFATLNTEVSVKARNAAYIAAVVGSIIASIVSALVLYSLIGK